MIVGLVDANIQTAIPLGNLSFGFIVVIAYGESSKLPGTGPSPGFRIWLAGPWGSTGG